MPLVVAYDYVTPVKTIDYYNTVIMNATYGISTEIPLKHQHRL